MEKNYFFKSFQLGKQFLFVLFFLSQIIVAQTAFTSGDKVEVYYDGTGSADVIADDNDADTTNQVSNLKTSSEDNTPLLTAGDVVVYRNSGTQDEVDFDVVAVIDAVVPYSGTLDSAPSPMTTTYSTGSVVDGNGEYPNFVMPTGTSSLSLIHI